MRAIIVGAGEIGYRIALRLSRENKDVIVIDRNPKMVRRVRDTLDVEALEGTGSSPSLLVQAGIRDAGILVAVTDSDEVNIMACLFANVVSRDTVKIARIRNQEYLQYRDLFRDSALNIDRIISPEMEVVQKILSLFDAPGAADVLHFADGIVQLTGVEIKDDSILAYKKLAEMGESDVGANVLIGAIIRGQTMIVPSGEDIITPGDIIYAVSGREGKKELLATLGVADQPMKNVVIVGGGHLGRSLAARLDKTNMNVRLMDLNADLCREIANELGRVMVLHGDATDPDTLAEERVQEADILVAATGDEEQNVLISMLAKQMGIPKTITRVQKFSYISLSSALGIDTVVSTHLAAVDATLQFIRKGRVMSVAALKGEMAEAIEVVAQDMSRLVGAPLKTLKFPRGALIGAIVRDGKVLIPRGNSVIQAHDRVLIFAHRDSIPAVEKFLTP